MSEASGNEPRHEPRYEVNAFVDYTGSEILLYHCVENISIGGVCILSTTLEQVGTIVDLVINFPDSDTSIEVKGEVVWVNDEPPLGMGIRYLDLDEDKKKILRDQLGRARQRGQKK